MDYRISENETLPTQHESCVGLETSSKLTLMYDIIVFQSLLMILREWEVSVNRLTVK